MTLQYFTQVSLPRYENLFAELNTLVPDWHKQTQICLNAPENHTDDIYFGNGSLLYDWSKRRNVWDEVKQEKILEAPLRTDKLSESDFTHTCDLFKGTTFETILDTLNERYVLGRVRIMVLHKRTCYSWHEDEGPRLHYAFKTSYGNQMVIMDEVLHMPEHTWWMTETRNAHTAFNATNEARLHIVATILGTK